ncbi:MAG: STAS domain-containing protein [Planctomycetota bacterium]
MKMTVVEDSGDFAHLALEGRLDSTTVGALEVKFFALFGPQRHVAIIDLGGVSFIASMGIRILVTAAKTLAARKGRLVLFGPPALVRESLEAAGIDQAIPIADDEAEARRLAFES